MSVLIIDIETIAKPVPQEVLDEQRKVLAEEYKKEETIEKHLQDFKERYKFLPGGAEIICVGIMDFQSRVSKVIYDPTKPTSWIIDETVLELDLYPGHKFCGFNIKGFDLPVLLEHMQRFDTFLDQRKGRYDIIDLYEWAKFAGFGGSLNKVCKMFGLETKSASGDQVAFMYEQDKSDGGRRVAEYNRQDLEVEAALYRCVGRMWTL